MSTVPPALEPLFTTVANGLITVEAAFYKLPGSAIVERYVRSSHQNDPGRTLLEIILFIFAIRTVFQRRTRSSSEKHFIEFSEKVRSTGCKLWPRLIACRKSTSL